MAHDPKPLDELIKAPPTAYRRGDAIAKVQVVLPVFAVLAALGFGMIEWLARGEGRYSPGPLATVHSQWDNQCAACHETSQPLAALNWFAKISDQGHVADAKCQSCHAGPPHHPNQNFGDVVGCTACHRDHLGTPGRLLDVGDPHCVSCHANLDDHRSKVVSLKLSDQRKSITKFAVGSHPEFAAIADKSPDPGTIAFNHARHMIPGMGTDPAKPGPFTLAQIPPEYCAFYRKVDQTSDDSPVVLDCRSCHRTEASDFPQSPKQFAGLPAAAHHAARNSGANMAPIVYEQHCQACHPLSIDRKIPGDPKSDWLTIRHRQQPKEILETLRGHYTNLLLKGQWKPPALATPSVLPGKPAENKAAAKEIDGQAEASALKILLDQNQKMLEQKVLGQTTCQKCHPSLDPAKGIHQTIPPADIPAVWFKAARFDHTSHRAIECRECHAQAFPTSGPGDGERTGSTSSRDVMLPGIQICVKCHAPAAGAGATSTGGARYDCIACHTYHHGDGPLQGRGSQARQPAGAAKTVREFLTGK